MTDAINFYYANFLHQEAKKNLATHYFSDIEFGKRMSWRNAPVGFTLIAKSAVLTYGLPSKDAKK